jgi:Histidine kinase-, DNA gyrase B-, and HSP90-like ATPase
MPEHKLGGSSLTDDYEIVAPRAPALIEALRAVGYTVQTAIADLVDNSITASAERVRLDFGWSGRDSFISVTDDGSGMTDQALTEAMRAGSRSPLDLRPPEDLGRFGLGLKTASFSQSRRLTVASKRRGASIAIRVWDLDYVGKTGEWRLMKHTDSTSMARISHLDTMPQGTIVLWERLDRLVGEAATNNRGAHDSFLATANAVGEHLAMVFHQYLGGARPRLKLFINGEDERHRIRAWDPFLEDNLATFSLSDSEKLRFADGDVIAKGFVLPHKDRLTAEEFSEAAGPAGWNSQQGFYVYRNQRLLVPGGWLDLGYQNEEHFRLARIRVEIPNSTDLEWEIDVKKSRARPPPSLRPRLKELAEAVRHKAREVFAHRGRQAGGNVSEPLRRVWLELTGATNRPVYKIDRANPLVRLVFSQFDGRQQQKALEAMLRLIEATLPIQKIWLDVAERPDAAGRPFELEPPVHVREVLEQLYRALRADGVSVEMTLQRLLTTEPFSNYPELIRNLATNEN